MSAPDLDLFGQPIDEFKTAREKYGIWPLTVWPLNHQDPTYRKLKELVGDDGSARQAVLQKVGEDSKTCYDTETSIFDPTVAARLLAMYAPSSGLCLDPFAGGGTRAIMAAKHGLHYVGTELREAEVTAVRQRCERLGVGELVDLYCADAATLPTLFPGLGADFCYTCPPYWNLEEYEGGERDLSMLPSWSAFSAALTHIVCGTAQLLKPGAASCWVVGLLRDAKSNLLPLHHVVAEAHRQAGFSFAEEIILHHLNNGSIQRVGNFEKGNRRLVRVHEYALVFRR